MRSRNIKPGFFKNEVLVGLPFEYRLLFVGLWTVADRAGRFEDRPTRIKMDVFPADDVDVNSGLQALHDNGFIRRYTTGGKKYCEILAWAKHQNPHCKEAASTIPAPCEHHAGTGNSGASPADSLIPASLIPDSGISDSGIPDSGKMPASVEMRGSADIPDDLHPLNYSAKICEQIGIPSESQNLRAFAWALEVLIKSGKSRPAAYEFLLARVLDELELGKPIVWTFWCRDGRFNFPAGANHANGHRPTDSQFVGQSPPSTPCPLKFCDGSGWYVEQSTRTRMNCGCQSVNVGVPA